MRVKCERMEFSCSLFVMFVVLTVDQFVVRDDGLLEQQKRDSHVCWKNCTFPVILELWLAVGFNLNLYCFRDENPRYYFVLAKLLLNRGHGRSAVFNLPIVCFFFSGQQTQISVLPTLNTKDSRESRNLRCLLSNFQLNRPRVDFTFDT